MAIKPPDDASRTGYSKPKPRSYKCLKCGETKTRHTALLAPFCKNRCGPRMTEVKS